jgi:xanthine dehydrogenase YagR molybdenum-binding subunit
MGSVGEVGVSAAITNAIYHATGKRLRKLPVHIGDLVA